MTEVYYVIQVRTRAEAKFLKLAEVLAESMDLRFFWPRRKLRIRKRGRWRETEVPIFPGYVFLQAELIPPPLYWQLRELPGFYRFLKDNRHIVPLSESEARVLSGLLKFGEIVKKSTARFDADRRIRILEGPLKGMEGRIVKVDRRKGRAKVRLDLYEDAYLVDFGFTMIEEATRRD